MKKGVSLIVLSITILVMAILAATVIISLEDSGIIGRSKKAVNSSNFADEYTRLTVIKNGILTDNLGTITIEEFINELKAKGIIEDAVIDNTDGTKTITTKSGFEVVIGQSQSSDLNIALKDDGDSEIKLAQATFTDGTILSWEELKLEANGQKYYYNAAAITDTEIGDRTFYDCREIVSVVIPEGITKIGNYAFSECSVSEVVIPDSVTYIGTGAFWDSGITTVNISKNVTYIDPTAFWHTESININPKNENYSSEDGVLYNKNKTELIKYPSFKYSESFVIPNTVTTIGGVAFACDRGPASITVPNSITYMDAGIFAEAYGLENIYVYSDNPNYTTINGVLYNKSMTKLIKYPCNKQDDIYTLPTTIRIIGESAFAQGAMPFELVVPSTGSTLVVEESALSETSITRLTLPVNISTEFILALNGSFMLQEIIYNGTVAQWNALGLDEYQYELYLPPVDVICSNGTVTLKTALGE